MPLPQAVRALLAILAALGAPDVVAPPVVDWRDAGERAGQVVTVEGDVREAECSEDRCVLEFAPEDARGFRVVVLMAMFSRAADAPDVTYRGRRIRATGKVQRFQGRVEMVLRGTGQIELADTAAVTTPSTTRPTAPPPTAPPSTAPPPTAPVPTLPPSAPPPTTPPAPIPPAASEATPPPVPPAPPPPPAPSRAAPPPPAQVEAPPPPAPTTRDEARAKAASCERAKAHWRETASDVRTHTTALERCLRALPYRCHPESAALAAVLPLLDEAERQVDEACR